MLTIEQYHEKYPNAHYFSNWPLSYREELILEGYLLFTEESAFQWAGPFEGNYAFFVLRDFTNAVCFAERHKGKKYLDFLAEAEKERKAKAERSIYPEKRKWSKYYEDPSWEFPIKLYMLGNDDTSYTKCYRNKTEAMEEMNLFIANEPLDFNELIRGFGFIFTN